MLCHPPILAPLTPLKNQRQNERSGVQRPQPREGRQWHRPRWNSRRTSRTDCCSEAGAIARRRWHAPTLETRASGNLRAGASHQCRSPASSRPARTLREAPRPTRGSQTTRERCRCGGASGGGVSVRGEGAVPQRSRGIKKWQGEKSAIKILLIRVLQ